MKLSACTEWLFFHLWKTSPETQKSCEGIIIPETIFYRYKNLTILLITDGHVLIFGILQTRRVNLSEKLKKKYKLLK